MTALQILKDLKKLMERNLRLPSQSILPEIEKAIRWLEEELPREEDDLIEVVPSTYSDPIAKDAIDNLVDLINGGDASLEELQRQYVEKTGKQLSVRYKNDRERIINKLYPQVTD